MSAAEHRACGPHCLDEGADMHPDCPLGIDEQALTDRLMALLRRDGPIVLPQGPMRSLEASHLAGRLAWTLHHEPSPRWDLDAQAYYEGYNAAADDDDVRPWGTP